MEGEVSQPLSHLFRLRMWVEEMGSGRVEYRGKVLHILSGDACHFRDWAGLESFLTSKLDGSTDADTKP